MAVTESILLYRCEMWADALKTEKYRKRMAVKRNPQSSILLLYCITASSSPGDTEIVFLRLFGLKKQNHLLEEKLE